MRAERMVYDRKQHAAARTSDFLFHQLIPYIGNKRKLLGLIDQAVSRTSELIDSEVVPDRHATANTAVPAELAGLPPAERFISNQGINKGTYVDFFAGSGVVSRFAKLHGYRVVANDWEPYAQAINRCYIACNRAPGFTGLGGYETALRKLNAIEPAVGWVTEHLCPRNDRRFDIQHDRMFYMRKNGMRIDAIREQIAAWKDASQIDEMEEACLLAPLVYQACYRSNTSGVFKGFHNGWGGQTGTALYRIATDLELSAPVFHDNGQENLVFREDAQTLAERLADEEVAIAYLDPPYNQHPYGSNYHVLNSVVLWDKPKLSKQITRGTKAAIRLDWRTDRRSAYNYKEDASKAYRRLLATINARWILTSYSTDGMISLEDMLRSNIERGRVSVVMQGYKRYRVSSQRFSKKPMNVEFVLMVDTHRKHNTSVEALKERIERLETSVLENHPECQVEGLGIRD
jgi:adenine-specific DNA-methyltransferase